MDHIHLHPLHSTYESKHVILVIGDMFVSFNSMHSLKHYIY